MSNSPQILVSVIVPICNVEKYLDQCLNSIRKQTHNNLEIICLNDGSKDGSLSIMKEHAEADSRIVVIDKENEGYGATCNRGINMAKGDYISIIEPDDYILPTMYEEMLSLAVLFADPIDIIKTPWIDIACWNDPRKETKRPSALFRRITTSTQPFRLKDAPFLIESHPSIWSAIYRRSFLNENNIRFIPYPGAGWADNPFLVEAFCQANTIVYLDKPFYCYRTDLPGSTLNHTTDEAVARPFDRWLDMMDILDRLHESDRGILESHYLRGFNYIAGAIYDDGWNNPVVQKKTREVFKRMDEDIVLNHPKIHPQRKHFYLEQTGKLDRKLSIAPYRRYLLDETIHNIRAYGIFDTLNRIVHHAPSKEPIAVRIKR